MQNNLNKEEQRKEQKQKKQKKNIQGFQLQNVIYTVKVHRGMWNNRLSVRESTFHDVADV